MLRRHVAPVSLAPVGTEELPRDFLDHLPGGSDGAVVQWEAMDELLPRAIVSAAESKIDPFLVDVAGRPCNRSVAELIANGAANVTVQTAALFDAEASRWPSMRAARVGTEDNQRHGLSHAYKIFGALDLPPLEVVGLEALGFLGLQWKMRAADAHGCPAGPVLTRLVLADPVKARICRLTGAVVSWRHMRAAYLAQVEQVREWTAAGNTEWRRKKATAEQVYMIGRIVDLIRAEDAEYVPPTPRNRGEASDIIEDLGGNPMFRAETDKLVVDQIVELIAGLNEFL